MHPQTQPSSLGTTAPCLTRLIHKPWLKPWWTSECKRMKEPNSVVYNPKWIKEAKRGRKWHMNEDVFPIGPRGIFHCHVSFWGCLEDHPRTRRWFFNHGDRFRPLRIGQRSTSKMAFSFMASKWRGCIYYPLTSPGMILQAGSRCHLTLKKNGETQKPTYW